MNMKKKIKKVEAPTEIIDVKRNFLDNFPAEEKRATTTWILTLIIFFLILHSANYDFSKASSIWLVLLLIDILIGGIAFLYLLVNVGSNLFKKETFIRSAISVSVIGVFLVSFFVILFKLPTLASTTANSNKNNSSSSSSSSLIALPSPIAKPSTSTATPKPTSKVTTTTGSKITCVGPDDKQFETTMDECKSLNEKWGKQADWIVNCNIHASCGGGTKSMKKSECEKPCTPLPGYTTTTPVTTTTQNNATKNAVYISYGGYTVYCPPQNVGAVMTMASTMESKKMEWAKNYNDCSDLYTNSDSCWVNCKNTHSWASCNYGTPEYTACSDAVSASYTSCISACPSIRDHCDYVYAEQKNLSNQINLLCK